MENLELFALDLDEEGIVPNLYAPEPAANDDDEHVCSAPSPAAGWQMPVSVEKGTDGGDDKVSVEDEQLIVRNVLLRMFNEDMTHTLLRSFYGDCPRAPVFCDAPHAPESLPCASAPAPAPAPAAPAPSKPAAAAHPTHSFHVSGFVATHFAKDPFPKFTVRLVPTTVGEDGVPSVASRASPLPDVRVRLSVHNRWADVSAEVVPGAQLERVVKDGCLEVSDLVFHDVSMKHGGHFLVRVECADGQAVVAEPWESAPFVIQSVKTHCNKKRKLNEAKSKSVSLPPPPPKRKTVPLAFAPAPQPPQQLPSLPSLRGEDGVVPMFGARAVHPGYPMLHSAPRFFSNAF